MDRSEMSNSVPYRQRGVDAAQQGASNLSEASLPTGNPPPAHRVLSDHAPQPQPLREIDGALRPEVEKARSAYAALYTQHVYERDDGTRFFDKGVVYQRHGLNVMFLKGDRFEMAFQHGRLLKDQILCGASVQAQRMIENNVANNLPPALARLPYITELASGVLHRCITDSILKTSFKKMAQSLEGNAIHDAIAIADATGFPIRQAIRSVFNPEVLLYLATVGNTTRSHNFNLLVPVSCCSSFAAWGKSTANGEMLVGRNMDFPLNGFYDKFPTVIYFEPTDGAQRYMTFVSAGLHSAGLNAVNESGIFLSCHTIPTKDVSVNGVPVFVLATEAIRHAKTLDEAKEVFKKHMPPTGWGYLLASLSEGKAVGVEVCNSQIAFRETSHDYLVQTNHFLTPEMRPKNMFINRSVVEDNDGRYIRIEQCLNETQGSLDVRGAMKILADGVDPLVGKVRGLGATVGMHTNMTSVVLDPSRAAVYVASGEAPSSRSDFVRLPLVGTFDPDDFPSLPLEFIPNTDFQSAHPEKHAAQQEFIKAKTAYEFQNDLVRGKAHLEKAVELDPGNPEYWYQLGIFAINNKDFARAREAFDSVFSCEYLPIQKRLLTHYWRGRLHAYHREYYEASVQFRKVITEPSIDIKLDAAARRALNRVVSRRRIGLGNIPLMMQQGDHLRY